MTEPLSPPGEPFAEASNGRARELLNDRRALGLIAGAVLGLAALGTFVVLPALHNGTSSSADALPLPHHHRATATASAGSATPTPSPTATVVPKVRDPFAPLLDVGGALAGGPLSGAPVVAVAPVAPVTVAAVAPVTPVAVPTLPALPPSAPAAPIVVTVTATATRTAQPQPTSATPTPTTTSRPAPPPYHAQTLTLVTVNPNDTAEVTVNNVKYHVVPGKVFACDFELLTTKPTGAEFAYSTSQQFFLTTGFSRTFS